MQAVKYCQKHTFSDNNRWMKFWSHFGHFNIQKSVPFKAAPAIPVVFDGATSNTLVPYGMVHITCTRFDINK